MSRANSCRAGSWIRSTNGGLGGESRVRNEQETEDKAACFLDLAHRSIQSVGIHGNRSEPAGLVQLSTKALSASGERSNRPPKAASTVAGSEVSGRSTNSLESLKTTAFCTARSSSPWQNTSLVGNSRGATQYGLQPSRGVRARVSAHLSQAGTSMSCAGQNAESSRRHSGHRSSGIIVPLRSVECVGVGYEGQGS